MADMTVTDFVDKFVSNIRGFGTAGGDRVLESRMREAESVEEAVRLAAEMGYPDHVLSEMVEVDERAIRLVREHGYELDRAVEVLEGADQGFEDQIAALADLGIRSEATVEQDLAEIQANNEAIELLMLSDPRGYIHFSETGQVFKKDARGEYRQVSPQTGEFIPGGLMTDGQTIFEPFPEGETGPKPEPFIGGFPEHFLGPNPDYAGIVEQQARFDRFRHLGLQEDYAQMFQQIPDEFRPPIYRDFDNISLFAGKTPEYIAQVQQQLIDSGLLTNKDVIPGYWGEASERAMLYAMDDANGTGSTWQEVLGRRSEAMANLTPEQLAARAGRAPFTAPAYLEPDYATLSQAVRRTFAQMLGRDPEDYELALLAQQMDADFRSSYGAELSAARAEYDAGNRAIVEGEAQAAGTFQAIDPMARFQERMLAKYGTEIERREDIGELQQNAQLMMRSLGGLESMVGG
jgi:hypothetical protein